MKIKSRITPGKMRLYGVFGFPLKHTLSPAMHQAAFRHWGLPYFYLALEMDSKRFRSLMRLRNRLVLDGFNLTIPHKQTVLPYLDSVSAEARVIGAVNTVIRKGSRWLGENTDAYGFLKSLEEALHWKPKGKSVLILGAGGASRACVYALARGGARNIVILNRTLSKANQLANEFRRRFPKTEFEALPLTRDKISKLLRRADLVVNTTSLGLKRDDCRLVRKKDFPGAKKNQVAVDLIYNPPVTPFLKEAKRAGWKAVNGLGMLLHQGARSFELWTGKRAPIQVMRKALEEAIEHGRAVHLPNR